jgi:predicted RNA-binding Zn ribbon-like protein
MGPTDQHHHGGSRAADRPTDHRGRYVPDGSWPPGRGAPEPLERVRRFVNTANPESGADHFETPASLAAWMEREGHGRLRVTERDRTRVVLLRAAVRELAIANHEGDQVGDGAGPHAAEAGRLLDGLAADLPLLVRFSSGPALVPVSAGVDQVLSRLLATLHDAMVDGTWCRLKACRNSHCRWAFYDHSRNSSGAWCSELACGSRMKVRAYRARQRAGRDAAAAADVPSPAEGER